MGIPIARQRDMMDEALDVIVRLLRGEEVTHDSDWFKLNRARLQMTPYSRPSVEIAVASQVSPTGARAAGKHGLGLLSIGATSDGGFNALASNWAIAEDLAKENGTSVDRAAWRLVGPMHIAETKDQAIADVRFGLEKWLFYFREIANLPLAPTAAGDDPVEAFLSMPMAVVGTPDDAAAKIEALIEQSGGFGCFLFMAHNWAPWAATKRSYELFARYVAPKFQGLNENRHASMAWVKDNKADFTAQSMAAVGARIAQHAAEKGAGNLNPVIAEMMGLNAKSNPEAAE
jgi:limonene 1,2-monooxygenase